METNKTTKTQVFNLIILDKSGSMDSIRKEAIAGYNETLGSIKAAQLKYYDTQEHYISLAAFCGCGVDMIYDCIPVKDAEKLTKAKYNPCCMTPLYDAIGKSIKTLEKKTADIDDVAVLVTIITDGMENASNRYTYDKVSHMIERQKRRFGWEFLFLGANIDAVAEAKRFGIDESMAANYHCDEAGTALSYRVISEAISCVRGGSAPLSPDWKLKIDEDYKKRGGKR